MDTTQISEFKRLLFEGPVKFSFTKRDGTIREALGTMKPALLPSSDPPHRKYRITNLVWKQDIQTNKRPFIPLACTLIAPPNCTTEQLSALLEQKYTLTPESFSVETIPTRPFPNDSILFYDLEHNGFRSCKIDSLLSFEAKA